MPNAWGWLLNLRPKLFELLPTYTRGAFVADALAGVTVGFVALPLALAFAIASGVSPQAGLYTAIVGGLIVSIFGGSRTQIAGPTGAFVIIVASIIVRHGVSGLLMVTMMAGAILLMLGLTGLGNAVKYLPRPVVIGFTNGIALLIASTQIKDFFGLKMTANPTEFFERMMALLSSAHTVDAVTTAVALLAVLVFLLVPKLHAKIPGAVVAVVVATVTVAALHLHVDTIASRFGAIPAGFPHIDIPAFRPDLIVPLLPSALTVAILAAVESLLSAVVADELTGDRHNSNAELAAQGLANLVVPMFGGIPVTGAIARTATNVRYGARTPVAGIFHSLTLLAIVVLFAPYAGYIPIAALAGVLIVVAYRIGEWKEVGSILRLDKADKAVWLATFILTVVADLTTAVEVGMALAALLYIYRVSQTTTVSVITPDYIEEGRPHVLQDKAVPPYVSILRIHGPFLFGTSDKLAAETADLSHYKTIVIVRLRNMTAIDATGLHALEVLQQRLRESGRSMLLCGARAQPAQLLRRAQFVATVGAKNILPNVNAALDRAREIHDSFDGLGAEFAADLPPA
jgi:SulP family sulfate permease